MNQQVGNRQGPVPMPGPSRLFTPAVTVLLMLLVLGFILSVYAAGFTSSCLLLNPGAVFRGAAWQLVTYSLVNGSCTLVFSGLLLLFIGSAIEREWGTRSFSLLWIVISVVCGLLWCLVGLFMTSPFIGMGTTPCVYGLIGAFGLMFRRRQVRFFVWPIASHHLALIMIGIGVVMSIAQPLALVWVAGAGVAYLHIKLCWRIRDGRSQKSAKARGPFVDVD